MKQMTLAQLQRAAETDMKRLGLTLTVEVRWGGEPGGDGLGGVTPPRCARGRWLAHAHTYDAKQDGIARICIRRGLSAASARETIRHEVAHFAPGGDRHGISHVKTQAVLGSRSAKMTLVRAGKARCPKHQWEMLSVLSERMTTHGLVRTYAVRCRRCGKRVE